MNSLFEQPVPTANWRGYGGCNQRLGATTAQQIPCFLFIHSSRHQPIQNRGAFCFTTLLKALFHSLLYSLFHSLLQTFLVFAT